MARTLLKALAALLLAVPLLGQGPQPEPVRDTLMLTMAPAQLVVSEAVHDSLAAHWQAGTDATEQGWCVTAHAAQLGNVPVIYLTQVTRPDSVWAADAYRVGFRCPDAAYWLHTHTPVTCQVNLMLGVQPGSCRKGGDDAWECQPSPSDQVRLTMSGRSVAFIQCDQHAIIAYYPVHRIAVLRRPAP